MMRIILKIFFLLLNCSCYNGTFSQNRKIDSLLSVLKTSATDTVKVNTLLSLAIIFQSNNPEKAIEYGMQSLQLSDKLDLKKEIGKTDVVIGIALNNLGKYSDALSYLSHGQASSQLIKDNQTISHAYNIIGIVYTNLGKNEEALKMYLTALKIQEKEKSQKEIADSYSNLGMTYEKLGKYDDALKNQLMAISIRKEIGDTDGIAGSFNLNGMVYRRMGNYTVAMRNHIDAIKILEKTDDKQGIAYADWDIGIIYYLQNNYSESMKYSLTALKIYSEIKNKQGIANALGNIGAAYYYQGDYDSAFKNMSAALKIFVEIGDKQNSGIYYNNIGFYYKDQHNYKEAMKNLFLAVKISEEVGDKSNVAETYESAGEAYYAFGKYKKALSWLTKAAIAAKNINGKRIIKECYSALSDVYEKLTDYKNAYKYQKLYDNTKELLDEESGRKIAEMIANYETEKKNDEIQLLNKNNELLSKGKELQAAEIRRQHLMIVGAVLFLISIFFIMLLLYQRNLKRKEVEKANNAHKMAALELQSLRTQLNPHFMFNSLNAIQELIVMEENELSQTYLERFARLLRTLLENADQPFIPLRKEIDFLELYLSLESLRIPDLHYSIEVDPGLYPEKTMIPNMILQPYIENALWHGLQYKKGEKKLQLHIYRQNDSLHYEIKDNGVGRKKASELKSLYRKEHRSKGMELLSRRFSLLSKEYGQDIKTRITDIVEDGDVAGTLVEIIVPSALSEQNKTYDYDTDYHH